VLQADLIRVGVMDSSVIFNIAVPIILVVFLLSVFYGLFLLARVVKNMSDLRERLDDLKVRLGVLDPGDTRVNPLSQLYQTHAKTPPPHAPDETLPGNG
jgi:hypothetical protein